MTVLLTRPRPDSESLARELSKSGIDCLIEPMLTIHAQPFAVASLDIQKAQALLLTSKHSLLGADTLKPLLHLPVLAVGDSTAAQARKAGFTQVTSTGKQVKDMVAYIQQHLKPEAGSLIYFSGRDITTGLSAALTRFAIQRTVSYHAEATSRLSDSVSAALREQRIQQVVFFSSRTARSFEACLSAASLGRVRQHLHAICISKSAAASLDAQAWDKISISAEPTAKAITQLVIHMK